jgi:hypothetical protein
VSLGDQARWFDGLHWQPDQPAPGHDALLHAAAAFADRVAGI